ncbi:MAG: glycerophosphodiester phosphodiesterase [Clostridia bacterium]|nr:glycerophosphodiester phosphodiesterase [Clostridia bacterium]
MRLIAHACGPTIYPSNSILSAREALKSGAEMVELDLQFTSDKKLAVFHDADLMKKFGDPRKCCEVTANEFLAMRRRVDIACPSHLLEHFFECGISPILLHFDQTTLEATLELVEEYHYLDRVCFGVTQVCSLLQIKKRFPQARVLGFIHEPESIDEFAKNGVDFIRLWERWMIPENIERVKRSGAELWVMTGGPGTDYPVGRPDRAGLLRVAAMEPDGLLVNDIPFVKSVLAER